MKTFLFPLLLLIFLIGAIGYKYATDLELNREHYGDALQLDAERKKESLEARIGLIQHNLRTIASLPDIRAAGRDVSRLNASDFHIIQQVFSTLRDNLDLSSLYLMALAEPTAAASTANALMPTLALNPEFRIHPDITTLSSEWTETGSEAQRLTTERLQIIQQNLAHLAQAFPDLKAARAAGFPEAMLVYSSAPERIADQWQLMNYSASNTGFMFVVPVYGSNGRMSGAIVGNLSAEALLDDIVEEGRILLAPAQRLIVARDDHGAWRASWPWLRQGSPDPGLIFSSLQDIVVHEQVPYWRLWSSKPDTDFWNTPEVKSARLFAWSTGLVAVLLCSGLMVVMHQQHRHKLQIEGKNAELEQNVLQRTRQLQSALDEARKISTALAKSESRHKAIFDNSADGIIIIAPHGVIESINPAALAIFGYRREEVLGCNVSALMPEPYHSQHDGYLRDFQATGTSTIIGTGPREVEGLHKQGHRFPLELQVATMEFSGKFRLLGICRDISKRKRDEAAISERDHRIKETEQQLLQSEKMASIGQLAAGVAHEINNPIGYVYSNLGTLMDYINKLLEIIEGYERAEQAIDPDNHLWQPIVAFKQTIDLNYLRQDLPELMSESHEGIQRVRQIVDDLKDFSHVETAEWQHADIHAGINSTLNIVHNELKYKAEVIKRFGSLPAIECIPAQLNQVFLNLLVNACHAIVDRGTITITSGAQKDAVWVEVCDTGQGIPAENLDRIFEPFYTTKPIGKGTGLGLSLAYGIIQKHHGQISVTSTPGEGSCFRIQLPIAQPKTET